MNNTGAAPCRQFKGSPEIPPQWRTRHSTPTVISTVGSGVEKSHSSIVQEAMRQEISRLRASWERLPSAPYRHAAPLEMTVAAGTPIVISTEAKRSGEISLL